MSATADVGALRRALRESSSRIESVIARELYEIHSQFGITPTSVRVEIDQVVTEIGIDAKHILRSVRIGIEA